jgi:hypothetical protein
MSGAPNGAKQIAVLVTLLRSLSRVVDVFQRFAVAHHWLLHYRASGTKALMSSVDHSTMSDDEFFEDFSGCNITDDELEEILARARQTSNIELRQLVKHTQYLRWLVRRLLKIAAPEDSEHTVIKLAQAEVRTFGNDKKDL